MSGVSPSHRLRRVIAACGLLACAAALTGCVASESSRYRGTVSRSVKPEHNANTDVASAFGLRTDDGHVVSMAAVDE